MTNRSNRKEVARETVAILERGSYFSPGGSEIRIGSTLAQAVAGTRISTPDEVFPSPTAGAATAFEITPETTFAAAKRVTSSGENICCLNFASAKNPGGGFLNGSQAQEESLARASGLYHCLLSADDYYVKNRRCGTSLYTDHLIYSPGVPVFRDDGDDLLEEPYLTSIITAPAVNAGAIRSNEPDREAEIGPRMRERTRRVLALATMRGEKNLILGAWGCGVFRNEPADMARWFGEHLLGDGEFAGAFRRVIFAIFDRTADGHFIQPFHATFKR